MGNQHFSAKIFIATAVIFPIFVVDGLLKVQISGNVKKLTQDSKVKTAQFALPKPDDKLSPSNCHLRILLTRTKAGNPAWETAQQAKVGWDGKYNFDFEVTDSDNVGTQYTWGLQTLSHQPVTLKVLKKTTKSIDIYADITSKPIVGLPQQKSGVAVGAMAFNKAAVEGVKLGLVKLVDPKTREDLQTQYGITKQITAQPPPEEEPKQKRGPIAVLRKVLWEPKPKGETTHKQKVVLGSIPAGRKKIWEFWRGGAKSEIHPVADTGNQENGDQEKSNQEKDKPTGTLNPSLPET
ncbi:hypothetical protein DdX_20051 [Ditylenchus destructor]|uniref:Uncharacterized protein n=1 Tax=Ditylenchus destructor TaxID=166010 RepID=A0AAD4MGU7_9BILA|nr:hypothetical protein DdX_20051 [Ditylenchus destructor]